MSSGFLSGSWSMHERTRLPTWKNMRNTSKHRTHYLKVLLHVTIQQQLEYIQDVIYRGLKMR